MVEHPAPAANHTASGAAAPWPADWDDIALLLASGLVDLADQVGTGQPVRMPYPVSLHRALDRLSVMCLAAGKNPPQSVADLLRWCSRPLSEWELRLAADGDDSVRLLVGGQPSRDCQELVRARTPLEVPVESS
jgi:pPIWI_RE three-gene island domain Y